MREKVSLLLAGAFTIMAGSALAMPANVPAASDGPAIQKVERSCNAQGYCWDKYTGQPLPPPQPRYRQVQPQYRYPVPDEDWRHRRQYDDRRRWDHDGY